MLGRPADVDITSKVSTYIVRHARSASLNSSIYKNFESFLPSDRLPRILGRTSGVSLSPTAQQPPVGQGLLIYEASRSHLDTLHWVGLPWTSGRPFAGTFTRQHTTVIRDRYSCTRRDSNPNPKKRATDNQYCRPRGSWIRHALK